MVGMRSLLRAHKRKSILRSNYCKPRLQQAKRRWTSQSMSSQVALFTIQRMGTSIKSTLKVPRHGLPQNQLLRVKPLKVCKVTLLLSPGQKRTPLYRRKLQPIAGWEDQMQQRMAYGAGLQDLRARKIQVPALYFT